ncbi:MAG: DNA polymerase III subunit chi [Salinisphaera sp.]|nr:DNA polymerase III subunit chi [Salinisphaera sp.]
MTSVTFYITDNEAADAAARLACRLAEKAHGQGHRLYLHTEDGDAATRLDSLLWTFRQGSFVPHGLVDELAEDDPTPIAIGAGNPPPARHDDVLVNLAENPPAFCDQFARVLDFVTPHTRRAARQRYRSYEQAGYTVQTHHIE